MISLLRWLLLINHAAAAVATRKGMPSPKPTPNPTLVDELEEAEGVAVGADWPADDVETADAEVVKVWGVELIDGIDEVEEEMVDVVVEVPVMLK